MRWKGHSSFQNYKVYKGSICLLYVLLLLLFLLCASLLYVVVVVVVVVNVTLVRSARSTTEI